MNKTFPLNLSPELHRRMKHASFDAGESLHDWVLAAIEQRLQALEKAPKLKKHQWAALIEAKLKQG